MTKLALTILLMFSTLFLCAQENRFAMNRSQNAVKLITSQMQISENNVDFLQQTLYNKYTSNIEKIRGKGLSNDAKQQIYREAAKKTKGILMTVFTKEEVMKIIKLEKESFEKN